MSLTGPMRRMLDDAALAGMPLSERSQEIWRRVRANHAKLAGCGDHDFSIDLTPAKPLGKCWQCTRCGGEVDAIHKGWYEEGRAHERGHPSTVPPRAD